MHEIVVLILPLKARNPFLKLFVCVLVHEITVSLLNICEIEKNKLLL